MDFTWAKSKSSDPLKSVMGNSNDYVVHHCRVEGGSDSEVQRALDASIEKACNLLADNIQDDSRYLLFGWDADTSTLTIVVTDNDKVQDSRDVVQCEFATNDHALDPEDIQFWIKDYLTTCSQFLRYSLIAAFHQESRASCTLL